MFADASGFIEWRSTHYFSDEVLRFRMRPSLQLSLDRHSPGILLPFCLVFLAAHAPSARAQPLDILSLNDLSEFREANDGWLIAGDAWGLWDSTDLERAPGTGVLMYVPESDDDSRLATNWTHGDLILELDYLVPKGSASGILLQGRYEVKIADSWGVERPHMADAAGISPRFDATRPDGLQEFEGHAPRANASKAPGLWQHLRIVFEAPRFDSSGRKTSDACIVEVVHNGVTVQESVRLGGPTKGALFGEENSAGPLVLGGSGQVAFRDISYRHYEPVEPVTLSNVGYSLYRGEFSSLSQMAATVPSMRGAAFGYVWDLFGQTADRFGAVWEGTIHIPRSGEYSFVMRFNWIDEIPYDEDAVAGRGHFKIGDEMVIAHAGSDSAAAGRIFLDEGEHPFEFSYFKNRRLWRPIVFFRVEGPGMPSQYLNAHRTLPEPETSYPTVPVEAIREPYVLRSFAAYDSTATTNVVSVGNPELVHYALDLDAGSLLAVWRGSFADVGSMWTGRGELQIAVPLGQKVDISDRPSMARLPNPDSTWPSSTEGNGFQFDGYSLDGEGRPAFRYDGEGVSISELFEPDVEGRWLTRHITFSGENRQGNLWIRAADGENVQERSPGVWDIDGQFFIRLPAGSDARLRSRNGLDELLVPVHLKSGEAAISYSIIW